MDYMTIIPEAYRCLWVRVRIGNPDAVLDKLAISGMTGPAK